MLLLEVLIKLVIYLQSYSHTKIHHMNMIFIRIYAFGFYIKSPLPYCNTFCKTFIILFILDLCGFR